jgi:hypothetical protein
MDERNGEWGTDKVTNTNTMKVTCIRGADFPAANGHGALEAPLRFVGIQKSDRIVKNGDLIIEISGGSPTQSTGRVCYINQKLLDRISTPVTTSNFCKIVSTIDINYFYFAYMTWLRLYESDIFFNFEGKTTGLKNLLFDVTTKSIKIPIPRKELLQKYQQISETYFSQIQELADENSRLTALRDFLLPASSPSLTADFFPALAEDPDVFLCGLSVADPRVLFPVLFPGPAVSLLLGSASVRSETFRFLRCDFLRVLCLGAGGSILARYLSAISGFTLRITGISRVPKRISAGVTRYQSSRPSVLWSRLRIRTQNKMNNIIEKTVTTMPFISPGHM